MALGGWCYVEFCDRYSPSFSICFCPFSVILLCYSIPSRHPITFRYSGTLRHSITFHHFRHILSFLSHSIFCPFFRSSVLFCLILSSFHIGIRPYRVPTSPFVLAPFLFQLQPLSSQLRCVPTLLYSYLYCSMIRSILIVPFCIHSDKL